MAGKEEVATKTAYVVSTGTAGLGIVSLEQWAIAVGILATIITAIGSLYFKHKHYQLAEEQAKLDRSYQDGDSTEQHRYL